VVEVVAFEPLGNGRLRRAALQGGMRIDHSNRCVKAGIRNADQPRAPVVVRHVLDQPVNRVPGVGRLVRAGRAPDVGHVVHELALGLELPARILVDEDVALFGELAGGTEDGAIVVGAVRGDAVRRARQEERIPSNLRSTTR